jgi:hypothetical protein
MRLRRSLAAAGMAVVLGAGYYFAPTGTIGGKQFTPPTPATGELFIAASGNDTTSTRSSVPITYAAAAAGGHVFASLYWACQAAHASDAVVVEGGSYPSIPTRSTALAGHVDGFNTDCSHGSAGDYNPNWQERGVAQGSLNGWVTFKCESQTATATWAKPQLLFKSNAHAIVQGGCFHFPLVYFGTTGDSSLVSQNMIFEGVGSNRITFDRALTYGGKNIWVDDWQSGPFVGCGRSGGTYPLPTQCDPTDTYDGEAQWATAAPNSPSSPETNGIPTIGNNLGYRAINIRFSNGVNHDTQTKCGPADGCGASTGWHMGCIHLTNVDTGSANPNGDVPWQVGNIVLDRLTCYRTAEVEFFDEGTDGWILENSAFGCQSGSLPTQGFWYQCSTAGSSQSIEMKCSTPNNLTYIEPRNIYILNNSSARPIFWDSICVTGGNTASNVQVVGNVAFDEGGCPAFGGGITWDYNVWTNPGVTCGTNSIDTGGTDPFKVDNRTAITYPPARPALDSVGFDPHLNGSYSFQDSVPSSAYPAGFAPADDYDGNVRSYPTSAGATR